MRKEILGAILLCSFMGGICVSSFSQIVSEEVSAITDESGFEMVTGQVTEIAEDGSYIVVSDGTQDSKFLTSRDALEEYGLEIGDEIEAYGIPTPRGLELIDCEYSYAESINFESEQELSEDSSDSGSVNF